MNHTLILWDWESPTGITRSQMHPLLFSRLHFPQSDNLLVENWCFGRLVCDETTRQNPFQTFILSTIYTPPKTNMKCLASEFLWDVEDTANVRVLFIIATWVWQFLFPMFFSMIQKSQPSMFLSQTLNGWYMTRHLADFLYGIYV